MADQPIALITGGAQGIGYASAEALAEDGSRIVIADLNGDKAKTAAEALGGVGYACDVGDPAQIAALFDQVEAEVGAVSQLVNCAGIAINGDLLDMPLEDFTRVIDVNLTGTFLCL
ncbi:MAG: SDR family NAD(P)-dependent oxidoreductase, partial [Pseudomonadota bacterium]